EASERDPLRAAVAARAIRYAAMGPWSAGTAAVLLSDSAGGDGGAAGQATFIRGGPEQLVEALTGAARSFGAQIRCEADVVRIASAGDRATGVALQTGEEISAGAVRS